MGTFDGLETRLQKLLEHRLLQLLPGHKPQDLLAQKLAMAMHANLKLLAGGKSQAPNTYIIVAHPSTLANWYTGPSQLEALATALVDIAKDAQLLISPNPKVSTLAESGMSENDIRILARFGEENLGETQNMDTEGKSVPEMGSIPENAFFILQGVKTIPLDKAVMNIGRKLDNQVVIDDPRVSRNHAQLRVIKGRFVIFDLESTGGLFINGQRASQSVLYPGDVISLAGVTMVFGQDIPSSKRADQGKPISYVSADRPTVIFNKKEKDEK